MLGHEHGVGELVADGEVLRQLVNAADEGALAAHIVALPKRLQIDHLKPFGHAHLDVGLELPELVGVEGRDE